MSDKKKVLAVQLPGVKRHTRHVLEASGEELASLIERLKARCALAGQPIARMILSHEAGRDGFWLARFLVRRGVEVHVMQPSSLPVDRRARRAKTVNHRFERMRLRGLTGASGGHRRTSKLRVSRKRYAAMPSKLPKGARRYPLGRSGEQRRENQPSKAPIR